jgi:hypothetical protein
VPRWGKLAISALRCKVPTHLLSAGSDPKSIDSPDPRQTPAASLFPPNQKRLKPKFCCPCASCARRSRCWLTVIQAKLCTAPLMSSLADCLTVPIQSMIACTVQIHAQVTRNSSHCSCSHGNVSDCMSQRTARLRRFHRPPAPKLQLSNGFAGCALLVWRLKRRPYR